MGYGEKVLATAVALAAAHQSYGAENQAPMRLAMPHFSERVSLELGATANAAVRDVMRSKEWGNSPRVHTAGGELTLAYAATRFLTLDLRAGIDCGSNTITESKAFSEYKERMVVNNANLMPGVRFTLPIGKAEEGSSSPAILYVGANAGLQFRYIRLKSRYDTSFVMRESYSLVHEFSAFGFGYSAEAGASFRLDATDDSKRLFIAYRFSGSTARPIYKEEGLRAKANEQIYHTLCVGLSCGF